MIFCESIGTSFDNDHSRSLLMFSNFNTLYLHIDVKSLAFIANIGSEELQAIWAGKDKSIRVKKFVQFLYVFRSEAIYNTFKQLLL